MSAEGEAIGQGSTATKAGNGKAEALQAEKREGQARPTIDTWALFSKKRYLGSEWGIHELGPRGL
jgi:hypothetical protein